MAYAAKNEKGKARGLFKPFEPNSNPNSNPFETISNPNYKYTLAPMQLVTPSVVAIAVAIDTMS